MTGPQKYLRIRIPKERKAYAIFQCPVGNIALTIHDDGTLHLWIGEDKHHIIKPDNKDIKIVADP